MFKKAGNIIMRCKLRCLFICMFLVMLAFSCSAQTWQWGRRIGGPDSDPNTINPDESFYDLVTDAQGNIYVCGTAMDNANANGLSLTSNGFYDIVIAKYNCEGDLVWIKKAGGWNEDRAYGLALDNAGHIYVT